MSIRNKFTIFTFFKGLFLGSIVFFTIYPFLHILAVSLSDGAYVMQNVVTIIPKGFTLFTYIVTLSDSKILIAYLNTIELVALGTIFSLIVTTMGGYALSQKNMLFKKFFSIMVVIPMFFTGGIIPTYLVVRQYGLIDKIWAIILPYTANMVYLLIMRTFFSSISTDLIEAGKIDGLRDTGVFRHIVLPLSKPILTSIGMFYGVAYWNTWFAPFIYLSSPAKYPLQLVLRGLLVTGEFTSNIATDAGISLSSQALKYTTIIISMLPIIITFPFIQKYFEKGIMIGSTKG